MDQKTISFVTLLGLVPTLLYTLSGGYTALLSVVCVLIIAVSLHLMFSGRPDRGEQLPGD